MNAPESSHDGGIDMKHALFATNAAMTNITDFLNTFFTTTDCAITHLSERIGAVEKSLIFLEAKLSRIPAVSGAPAPASAPAAAPPAASPAPAGAPASGGEASAPPAASAPAAATDSGAAPAAAAAAAAAEEEPAGNGVPLEQHPVYGRFFRMLKMGIPQPAVEIKMQSEGYDPAILSRAPHELEPVDDE